ncbi:hypothetical protein [Janthinobacterium sp. 75]|uniref:hypothetical protein n=1 Tax=Janthinobacterium sp. 75 TaxID=2135628 RepID=UPI001063DDD8|nr:hypothetical protein [Janthinobacterium sp. 75]
MRNLPLRRPHFRVSMVFLPSEAHPESMMSTYLPALIWSLSAFVCLFIAKRRSLKTTAVRAILVVFLGPFAIPFVLAARPEKRHPA